MNQQEAAERYPAILPDEIARFFEAAEYRVNQFVAEHPSQKPEKGAVGVITYILSGIIPDYAGMFRDGLHEQAGSLIAELLEAEFAKHGHRIDLSHRKLPSLRTTPTQTGMTPEQAAEREKHLQWCKDRAIPYAKAGDFASAVASFQSDMRKNSLTSNHQALDLMFKMLLGGHLSTPDAMVKYINGFN